MADLLLAHEFRKSPCSHHRGGRKTHYRPPTQIGDRMGNAPAARDRPFWGILETPFHDAGKPSARRKGLKWLGSGA